MFAWTSHGTELKRFARHPITRAAVAVMLLIPLLYGAMYVWAFWDPTAKLEQLPVALINEDVPTTRDGKPINAGQDVVDRLVDEKPLGWHLTTSAEAKDGLTTGRYYFAVTIPPTFSTDIASISSDHPRQAQINVTYDDTNSFLASTLGKSAMFQINAAVNEKISKEALDTLLIGVGDARDGFGKASDGAFTLTDALKKAEDGSLALSQGARDLASGSSRLADGNAKLADGTGKLASSAPTLSGGVGKLASGSQQLSSGLDAAVAAAPQLTDGTTSLYAGTQALAPGAKKLSQGATQVSDGSAALASATSSDKPLAKGAAQVAAATAQTPASLATLDGALAAAQGALASNDIATAQQYLAAARAHTGPTSQAQAKALATGAGQVSGGIGQLNTQLTTLSDGARSLATGASQVDVGITQLDQGAQKINAGAHTFAEKLQLLATGARQLDDGLVTLNGNIPAFTSGITQLNDGAHQAAAGSAQLAAGSQTLADKSPELTSGLTQMQDGANELGTKLAEGRDTIPNDSTSIRDARATAIAVPTVNNNTWLHQADSWGEGFAPFFISLALWVGALITWLLLRPMQSRALMTSVNGFRMAWGSLNSALLIAAGQVVIMLTVMQLAIGLKPKAVLATFALTYLTAAAFMALQQFLQIAFGSAPGKVIVIVLLMVQLASAGGTYPIETTPDFMSTINPYLPMSYAVSGLREAITGGIETRFWVSVAVLASVFVVSLMMSSIAVARKRMWSMSRLHPVLTL